MFGKAMILKHDKKKEVNHVELGRAENCLGPLKNLYTKRSEICEMFMPLAAPEFAASVISYGPEN